METSYFLRTLTAALGVLASAGCATAPFEGKYAWSEGWRKGQVVAVQKPSELQRPSFYNCVRNASLEQRATGRVAVVKYRQTPRRRLHAVFLQPDDKVAAGDDVYVKVDACETALVQQAGPARPDLVR